MFKLPNDETKECNTWDNEASTNSVDEGCTIFGNGKWLVGTRPDQKSIGCCWVVATIKVADK